MALREVMTPDEVAEYLHLNKDTVYRLIRRKKLAATRIGNKYRIPVQDLEAFMLANSTRPEVRRQMFHRVLEIANRNPSLSSDEVLEELEEIDRERRGARSDGQSGAGREHTRFS
jgi:excisionase family DNA binding protein